MAKKLGVQKRDILDPSSEDLAVRMALAEADVVNETKKYLEEAGVQLNSFEKQKSRSQTTLLVKNIPNSTTESEIASLFKPFGTLGRIVLPPTRTIALVEYLSETEAKSAFKRLAFKKFKSLPLYLEWAPVKVFKVEFSKLPPKPVNPEPTEKPSMETKVEDIVKIDEEEDNLSSPLATIFVKNLSFGTKEEDFKSIFSGVEGVKSVRIATKPDPKNPGSKLSMGFGFVEFNSKEEAKNALIALQGFVLDGHALALKFSTSTTKSRENTRKQKPTDSSNVEVTGTKLVIRNVPFQATKKELSKLFSSYSRIKSIRLPKKFDGNHRGFAFVDFLTVQEAKEAFEKLGSIHLYGRHLVIEWAQGGEEEVDALRLKTKRNYVGSERESELKKRKVGEEIEGRLEGKNNEDNSDDDFE
ncbi:Multiple RNA-binding domain-containing protein 1 [Nowakowskiella sp. JEL0078]|nr:Multiple RNA-binding domain-containing protein 1 [Nowakowskiella sp. JEL0078]